MEELKKIDGLFIKEMHRYGVPLLRVALGIVFLWFGALKIFGVSPVGPMIAATYSVFPYHAFMLVLGIWEVVIGFGLLYKIALRATLALLWLQMAGTLLAVLLAPHLFFHGKNIFLLTTEGEFVIKNLVLIAAGVVIGGFEVRD